MELFLPNNLSLAQPEFVVVDDAAFSHSVSSVLKNHYAFVNASSLEIARFVGANVISQNFRLTTNSGQYFLKSRHDAELPKLSAEAGLATQLAAMGLKVPRVLRTTTDAFVSVQTGACWALYMFEEGRYFTGKDRELDSAAEAFGELTAAASDMFSEGPLPINQNENAFLEDLESLLQPIIINSPVNSEVASLCQTHRKTILNHQQEVIAKCSFVESVSKHMHLDYHPLNLLLRNGEVGCILDLEHLKAYPVLAGVGFAAYKLIRQALVDPEIRAREQLQPSLVARWLQGWHGSFPRPLYTAAQLGLGASYRVLALIHFILDAALRRGDDRFSHDLAKQIGSLYEIDVIFGLN